MCGISRPHQQMALRANHGGLAELGFYAGAIYITLLIQLVGF